MQRPGWWPVCQLCCSLPASPDHLPRQRSEKAGEEEEGHVAGREARCHLLLKVRVACLDRAGGSRMMVPSIASLQQPSPE